MPWSCFPPTVPSLDALLPSTGSPGHGFSCFNGTIGALRLPAVHPAALRFLRLAVPALQARFVPIGVACDAEGQGFSLTRPGYPYPASHWRRQGLPRSWGTPTVPLPCSSTPAGPSASGQYDATARPPLEPRRGLPQGDFRGSITRLRHSLSTLRRTDCSATTQDSLPAAGQALPDGLGYPQGPAERFQR
jgi:hypothetical protein